MLTIEMEQLTKTKWKMLQLVIVDTGAFPILNKILPDRDPESFDIENYQHPERNLGLLHSIFQQKLPKWWSDKSKTHHRERYEVIDKKTMNKDYFGQVFWDAFEGIALMYEGEPIACIGFEYDYGKEVLFIKQIQGIKGRQKELQPLRWEKMLVDMVIKLGELLSCECIHIQSAEENTWVKEGDPEEKLQRFKLRYDVTAQRMGFKYNEETKRFVYPLS